MMAKRNSKRPASVAVLVEGTVSTMPIANWVGWLITKATGQGKGVEEFGAKLISLESFDVTDWREADAAEALLDLHRRGKIRLSREQMDGLLSVKRSDY